MQTQFVREGMNNFMVINDVELRDDEYEINIFRYQNIPCFMSCEIREVNGEAMLYYKLKYRTSLKQAFGHISFTLEKINNIMTDIVRVLEVCDEYLLAADSIICTPDNVFVDVNSGRLIFGYCPVHKKDSYSLKELIMEILQNVDRRYEKGSIDLLQFYNILTEEDCSIDKLKQVTVYGGRLYDDNSDRQITDYREDPYRSMDDAFHEDDRSRLKGYDTGIVKNKEKPVFKILKVVMAAVALIDVMLLAGLLLNLLTYEKTGFLFVGMAVLIVLVIIYMHAEPEESPEEIMESFAASQKNDRPGGMSDAGDNGAYDDKDDIRYVKDTASDNVYSYNDIDGETMLLDNKNNVRMQLVLEDRPGKMQLKPVEKGSFTPIFVDGGSIVIGSMRGSCDHVISAKGISRLHAKLSDKGDGVYIMDMNSTNGTYQNGELLVPGKEYKLEPGDMVSFAKVQYVITDENAE